MTDLTPLGEAFGHGLYINPGHYMIIVQVVSE